MVPKSNVFRLISVGTRDGYLRSTDSESRECVFENNACNDATISALQFGTDGNVLISGNSLGNTTAWHTSNWEQVATVSVPGSVTNVAFHPDGTNVVMGSSQGEIRHWILSKQELSKYNLSLARPVNGLYFRNKGIDVIAALKVGYARAYNGPQSNPGLGFEDARSNLMFDFSLSTDGTRVATATHDGMIQLWNT